MGFEVLFQWLIDKVEELVPFRWCYPNQAGVRIRTLPGVGWLGRWWGRVPRTGQWVRDVGPGPVFKLPFFDLVHLIVVKRRNVDIDNIRVVTVDQRVMMISVTLLYRVVSARKAILDTEDFDTSLVVDTMAEITKWANGQRSSDITVGALVESCYPTVRRRGFNWGCEVLEVGVNSLAPHKLYSVLTQ